MKDKKLLITGANGFVGSHLAQMALDNGFEVFAAVRKSSDLQHLQGLNLHLVYPDYRNVNSLTALLEEHGITHIAHVAGMTKGKTAEDYTNANATVSVALAQAALGMQSPIKKFVFVSSLAAMGPVKADQMILEDSPASPVTLYGKSKLLAEQYLDRYQELPLITLRPTAVYGPRDKDMLIIIDMIRKGWDLYLGKQPQQLTFIYVKDLCSAILLALNSTENRQAYLLSDGQVYNRYDFADQVKKILNRKAVRLHVPVGLISAGLAVMEKLLPSRTSILNRDKLKELTGSFPCSIEKAQKELGYQPQYPLEKGLRETVSWNQARNVS